MVYNLTMVCNALSGPLVETGSLTIHEAAGTAGVGIGKGTK
jgi:hypothetical protein